MERMRAESALEMRARLFEVGARISAANVTFCKDKQRADVGLDALRPDRLPPVEQSALASHLGLETVAGLAPIVVGVAQGSPAEAAGIAVGDVILNAPNTMFADQSVLTINGGGAVALARLRRGDEIIEARMQPRQACDFPSRLQRSRDLNAFADGTGMTFYTAMMRLAQDDDLLATVYAHELAHNTMRHRDAKEENATVGMAAGLLVDIAAAVVGVNTQGQFAKMGGGIGAGAYSQAFESEADYVGAYYMRRAGYDSGRSAYFWARMAGATGGSVQKSAFGSTHPSYPERAAALRLAHEEMEAKLAAGEPLEPNIDASAETAEERRQAAEARWAARRNRDR